MEWMLAAWFGVAGGATMEAVDVIKSVRWHRRMPWNVEPSSIDPPARRVGFWSGEEGLPAPGWKAYCVAAVLRLFVSGTVAGIVGETFESDMNPLVLFLVGVGALSAVEQVALLVPLVVRTAGRAALTNLSESGAPAAMEPGPRGDHASEGREAASYRLDIGPPVPEPRDDHDAFAEHREQHQRGGAG